MRNLSVKKIFLHIFIFLAIFVISPASLVFAQASTADQEECHNQRQAAFDRCVSSGTESNAELERDCSISTEDFYQICLRNLETPAGSTNDTNPLWRYQVDVDSLNKLKVTSTQGFIGLVIKTATGIMGTVALVMLIYGGVLWMTSSGNASQVDKAQNVIFYAALGIFVIFGSYAVITFIFQAASPTLSK